MESIFNVVFKKIIDLLGSELGSKLFRRKDKFLGKLLDLYHQLKLLDSSISHLASSLKWVLDDIEHNRLYYDEVCGTLNDIRDILGVIGEDLEALAPGLEIYAVDAVKAIESLKQIEDFYVNEAIPNDLVNLLPLCTVGRTNGRSGLPCSSQLTGMQLKHHVVSRTSSGRITLWRSSRKTLPNKANSADPLGLPFTHKSTRIYTPAHQVSIT